jgi:lipopolysaccharide export system protein LptA
MKAGAHLRTRMRALWLPMLAGAISLVVSQASAEVGRTAPDNTEHFDIDRSQPVKIEAATLEVRDKDKKATFSGNVHVVQGETDLRCNILVVYYDNGAAKSRSRGAKSQNSEQQIRRMEATGNVVITQKDQRATGDRGNFDMRTNMMTLSGNVIVTRGKDVLRGERLLVNLTTGVSRMEAGGGRVEGLFRSNSAQDTRRPPHTN